MYLGRSQWPRGLRRRSAAPRLLRSWVRILRRIGRFCDRKDTLRRRISEFGDGRCEWECTRKRLAIILRTEPRWIPDEWLLRPQFTLWPPAASLSCVVGDSAICGVHITAGVESWRSRIKSISYDGSSGSYTGNGTGKHKLAITS